MLRALPPAIISGQRGIDKLKATRIRTERTLAAACYSTGAVALVAVEGLAEYCAVDLQVLIFVYFPTHPEIALDLQ